MTVLPSAAVYVACSKATVTDGTSSSVIETTLSFTVPSEMPVGSVPKVSLTLSPSSSTLSAAAAKEKVFSVSAAAKVRLAARRSSRRESRRPGPRPRSEPSPSARGPG